jgi:hypothetical protein
MYNNIRMMYQSEISGDVMVGIAGGSARATPSLQDCPATLAAD